MEVRVKKIIYIFLLSSVSIFAGPQALSELVYEIRDPGTESARFQLALEKIGEYLALDVLEELDKKEVVVETLTGEEATHLLVDETPVLITILRAGLPLNSGIQKVFPSAEVGFFAMSRNEQTLKADIGYVALPDLKGKSVIISDTMLATGGSLLDAIQIVEKSSPRRIFVIAAIASKPGIERIFKYSPETKVFAATIDPCLNEKGYIIPGLGDAGDRCYGNKSRD
jgi:uracil phosphoribosyltransferase